MDAEDEIGHFQGEKAEAPPSLSQLDASLRKNLIACASLIPSEGLYIYDSARNPVPKEKKISSSKAPKQNDR